ncbi:hypothetical protein [Macrococcoides caseolyticum]|uniref:hypothetical protein n=1 Tax=Macrococcoides caseolyticum TaxID=69966 RepID=UPI001F4590F2|nr:hypothetical protein [Macrococcus caseolyticus]MCE4957972.1 hypothetical protein [Macrococcus caseolyticus]
MKKLYVLIAILTLMLSACSQKQSPPLSKDELIERMQQSVKATNSATLHAQNDLMITFDKNTIKFETAVDSQYDTVNMSALAVRPVSNDMKYPVKPFIYNLMDGKEEIIPKPSYINYRAEHADRDYLQRLQSEMFNMTNIVQNVIKKDRDDLKITGNEVHYSGQAKHLIKLFDYGFNFSGAHQLKLFNQMTDVKVDKGHYVLYLSPEKKYMKSIVFDMTVSGKIDNKPVTMHLKQHTDFSHFNKTNVTPYTANDIEM